MIFGSGPLGDTYQINIKALSLVVSDKFSFMFSLYKSMLNMWPQGMPILAPGA